MRLLPLLETDSELFNSNLDRTLYMLYRENVKQFSFVWNDQGPGYWIKFCITLRSVMKKQGYGIHLASMECNHFDAFFIMLAELLTGNSIEPVHTYLKDVVSISRFHQLLSNIPNMFESRVSHLSPSFKRLFGDPEEPGTITRMCATLPLHLRAVGCLLEILRRWPDANITSKILWHPPETWRYGNQLKANNFEIFLKKHWGDKLLELIEVRAAEICWWNALPENTKASECSIRYSLLGGFICITCRDLNLPFVDRIKVLENEMFYCYFLNSAPRGKFVIFQSQPSPLVFTAVMLKGLNLTDENSVFHPYSQIIINFTNAAFSRSFWNGANGIEKQLKMCEEKDDGTFFSTEMHIPKEKANFLLKILATHMIKSQLAIKMNSDFYSTLSKGGSIWQSPLTLQRFSWNLPLFVNWLEIVLAKIFEFERHFIPVVHFKLRSSVFLVVSKLYRRLSEIKYLTKSCIIIVEFMMRNENNDSGRFCEERKLLRSVIVTIGLNIKFFEEEAYLTLEAILNSGWDKSEREDGESSTHEKIDRVTDNLSNWNTVPNIEPYYNGNTRSITFWLTCGDWPDISKGYLYFKETCKLLKNYKIGSQTIVKQKKEAYDFTAFNIRAKGMKFGDLFNSPAERKIGYITMILNLVVEDGWIRTEMRESFWHHYGIKYNLDLMKHKINNNIQDDCEGLQFLDQLDNLGTVFYMVTCVLGDTWKSNIVQQNSFTHLQLCEAFALQADSAARLSALIQYVTASSTDCPPAHYFSSVAAEIKERSLRIQLKYPSRKQFTLKDAEFILERLDKSSSIRMQSNTDLALDPIGLPQMEKLQSAELGLQWLFYLENIRQALLELIAEKQLDSKKSGTGRVELFPYYDIVEYRFLEEMAAMKKCLELGGVFYGPAYGLCRLLAHRFQWMQERVKNWSTGKSRVTEKVESMSQQEMKQALVNIRIRMMESLIYLKALFFTYISEYRTTHPINEITIEMMFEWVDVGRNWVLSDNWNIVGSCLVEYVKALEKLGCEYMEQLLKHCMQVWVVVPFAQSPEEVFEIGSVKHVHQIITTLTQLFLMSYQLILSRSNNRNPAMKLAEKIEENLVNMRITMRKLELDLSQPLAMWFKTTEKLKKVIRETWSDLLELRKEFGGPFFKKNCPDWLEEKDYVWRVFLEKFSVNQASYILQKIAYQAFMDTPNPENEDPLNSTKVSEQAKSKMNGNASITDDKGDEDEGSKVNKKKRIRKKKEKESNNTVNVRLMINKFTGKSQLTIIKKNTVVFENTGIEHTQSGIENDRPVNNPKDQKTEDKRRDGENLLSKVLDNIVINDEEEQQTSIVNEDTAASVDGHVEDKISNGLRTCAYCNSTEPVKRTYKKCGQCKRQGWLQPRYYCSPNCQVNDWKERHNMEHKNINLLSPDN